MTTEAEAQRILHERAAALSRHIDEEVRDTSRYIVFVLSGECYGLPVEGVREIVKELNITPVPGAPPAVEGVINLRGEILAVINLKKALGIEAVAGAGMERRIIVVGSGQVEAGLLVDFVSGIGEYAGADLDPPLMTLEKLKAEYLNGEIRSEDALIGILNLETILERRYE